MFDRHDIVNEADFVPIMYSLLSRVSFNKYSYWTCLAGRNPPDRGSPLLMAGYIEEYAFVRSRSDSP